MAARLDEAFLLSSYSLEHAQQHRQTRGSSSSLSSPAAITSVVYSEEDSAGIGHRGIAVCTVDGNGIHLVDLHDQSHLSSFTVNPATTFTCPTVSYSYLEAQVDEEAQNSGPSTSALPAQSRFRTRKTWAGVERDAQYELWCYTEQEQSDGTPNSEATKISKTYESRITCINVEATPGSAIVAFENGSVILLSSNAEETAQTSLGKRTTQHRTTCCKPLAPALYQALGLSTTYAYTVVPVIHTVPRGTANEAPKSPKKKAKAQSNDGPDGPLVEVCYLAIDPARRNMRRIAIWSERLADVKEVALLQNCAKAVMLQSDGRFITYELSSASGASQPIDLFFSDNQPAPVSIVSKPLKSVQLSNDVLNIDSISFFPLTPASNAPSSFLLMAASRKQSSEALVFLMWDVNFGVVVATSEMVSSIASTPSTTLSQRKVVLCQLDDSNIGLSIAPFSTGETTPDRASMHALPCFVPSTSTLAEVVGRQASTQEFIISVRRQLKTPGESRKAVISDGRISSQGINECLSELEKHLTLSTDSRSVESAETLYKGKLADVTVYPLELAIGILKLALPPANRLDLEPSSYIIDHVLSQTGPNKQLPVLVTDSAIFGGVTASLLARQAWPSVRTVMHQFLDIPEEILVGILRHAIYASDQQEQDLLTVTGVLRCILSKQYSEAAMKTAIRKGLGVQDLLPILDRLTAWMIADVDDPNLPSTKAVVLFTQALLDAHLINILQHAELHRHIRVLSASLSLHLAYSSEIAGLRTPINKVMQVQKEQSGESKQKAPAQGRTKYSREKIAALQIQDLSLGKYTVEEYHL